MTKKKKATLKTQKKFSVSMTGGSVPTFLQAQGVKSKVTPAQMVYALQDYLQEDPKFREEFFDHARTIPTGRTAQATDTEIAKLANELAVAIKNSKNQKQDVSFARFQIKKETDIRL